MITTETEIQEKQEFDTLATLRDELRLQMHLAKAELRDEWNIRLEPTFRLLKTKLDRVEHASAETIEKMRPTLKALSDELREGYERIRKSL
ncbi:MAG TPA: hypothetical protein VFR31_02470 [Thermoanaerobaculia bacterium]|nr:hypothetical protein [Thermoanaerobaculia bacterium]